MSRQKVLVKNTVILTVGKICTQFVSFLLLPLYTALLSPNEYGVADLFNTYITLLVPIFNWQFENGLFRFMLDCRNDKAQTNKLFSTVIVSNIIQSLIYLAFFAVAQGFITSEYKVFLAIDVVLSIFLNTLVQFPRGLGNNTAYAVGSFISAASAIIFNVIFIAGFKMGAYGMFVATIISKVVSICYFSASQKVWRYFSLSKYSKDDFMEICRYSLPLVPNQLSWWVIGASDRTIISYVINVAANGIYSVANKFSSVFITFYNIFNVSWTESVSLHIEDDDREEFLTDTINSMFRLFSAICLGIIACMPFVFPLIINDQYAEAYYQIPILMVAVLFQVVVGLYSVIYVALKMSIEIAKTSFYAAVINIVVNLALIGHIGLYAASFSTLIAYAAMALYRYFHIRKYADVALDGKVLVFTVVMGLLTILSYYRNHMLSNIITLLIIVLYAIMINRSFLLSSLEMVLEKINLK
ncbi:MAG: lipopolysaccharide biosynthesis protein [Lachnospiraceae bacterium]